MKKLIVILGALPLISFVGTLFYWSYRYIWFSIETVPQDKIFIAVMMMLFSIIIFIIGLFIADWIDKENLTK